MRLWIGVGDHLVYFVRVVVNIFPFRVGHIYKIREKVFNYTTTCCGVTGAKYRKMRAGASDTGL